MKDLNCETAVKDLDFGRTMEDLPNDEPVENLISWSKVNSGSTYYDRELEDLDHARAMEDLKSDGTVEGLNYEHSYHSILLTHNEIIRVSKT